MPRLVSICRGDAGRAAWATVAPPKMVLPICFRLGLNQFDGIYTSQSRSQLLKLQSGEDISYPPLRIGITMHHSDHPAIIKRLKRADGHLQKIIEMLEQGRPYPQAAQQLQAVEGAIENAKKTLIHDHISHCVNRSLKAAGPAGRTAMREFTLVARYL
jgi:DNA-binding FrmR family transcriptional regulator